MIRKGVHEPTIEDLVEISGIETLHPGGVALTKRTAELAHLKTGIRVLDVSCGRGTQAIYYAQEFGADVIGIDISENMIAAATENARRAGVNGKAVFKLGDAQNLPFEDNTFDAVINECAVGIPDDSQSVVNEMVRVAKYKGTIAIHESTWRKDIPEKEKDDLSERYGTTPLEFEEWMSMLAGAGVRNIVSEFDKWSKPEMFWNIRKDREVEHFSKVLTWPERISTTFRVFRKYGITGLLKAFENEKVFYRAVLDGKIGYCLFKGEK
ncbi:class I SAM-dependent methyltransferase [Thermodesulfobacteriota bacterium]